MELNSQVEKWEQAKSIAIHRPPRSPRAPLQKRERKKDEWNSFINKQEMKKKALLAEKQAKKYGGQKNEECQERNIEE